MKTSDPIRVAIIGAGASGITSAKCLMEAGIEPVVFEQSSEIGGVWKYAEGVSKSGIAYRSLRTNTSKRMMAFSDFPFPITAPDFPSRDNVIQYLNDYVDFFGLRKFIVFNSTVDSIVHNDDGKWTVYFRTGAGFTMAQSFNALVIASGLYQQPITPQFPGIETFQGKILHSVDYIGPEGFEAKRVIVVGVGSSGTDIAVEISQIAELVEISTRAGVWFVPHYIAKKPYDYQISRLSNAIPFRARMYIFKHLVINEYKRMGFADSKITSALSLPKFDVRRVRLTPGTQILLRILSGVIRIRPEILRIETNGVKYIDGTFVRADTIICATGYSLRFPFLNSAIVNVEDNNVDLFKHVFHPIHQNLAFIGMCIVNGPLFPVAEMQARWIARVFAGVTDLPPSSIRIQTIERQRMMYQHLQEHPMRVELVDYMDELALLINARPRPFLHPRLIGPLILGPLVSAQYRLTGPNKYDRAEEIIFAK